MGRTLGAITFAQRREVRTGIYACRSGPQADRRRRQFHGGMLSSPALPQVTRSGRRPFCAARPAPPLSWQNPAAPPLCQLPPSFNSRRFSPPIPARPKCRYKDNRHAHRPTRQPEQSPDRGCVDDPTVPLNYFNIVKLTKAGEAFEYQVPGLRDLHRACHGHRRRVKVGGRQSLQALGGRADRRLGRRTRGRLRPRRGHSDRNRLPLRDTAETFMSLVRKVRSRSSEPFAVRVRLSSTRCNTARTTPKPTARSSTSLGQKQHDKVGPLAGVQSSVHCRPGRLVRLSQAHKHDTDNVCRSRPATTRPTTSASVPTTAPACRSLQREDGKPGDAYHLDRWLDHVVSTKRLPPLLPCCPVTRCITSPSLAGSASAASSSIFQPSHADQVETIPGIKDMVAKVQMSTSHACRRPSACAQGPLRGRRSGHPWDGKTCGPLWPLPHKPIGCACDTAGWPGLPRAHAPCPILGKMFRHLAAAAG